MDNEKFELILGKLRKTFLSIRNESDLDICKQYAEVARKLIKDSCVNEEQELLYSMLFSQGYSEIVDLAFYKYFGITTEEYNKRGEI